MMPFVKWIARSERGTAVIEFALLAPVFIGLMFGVVQVGLYMQSYNAVRSLATDAARFAAVEYQKNNKMSEETLENNVKTKGINAPYSLADARLTIDFNEVTPSGIAGARKFDLTVTYALPDIIGGISIDNITLTYEREVYVLA